jgi:raffinose/stachyose/melibiose transport system permease protein
MSAGGPTGCTSFCGLRETVLSTPLGRRSDVALFLIPGLAVYTSIVIFPIFFSLFYSTMKWEFGSTRVFVGFANFLDLFKDPIFSKSIINSLIVAGAKLFIEVPLSLAFALILAWGVRGEKLFRVIYFLPTIISPVVAAQLFRHFYNDEFGELNNLLRFIGLGSWTRYWLADPNTALGSAIVMLIWRAFGYGMLIFYAASKNIPRELFESARMDGCGYFRTQFSVTIPLIRPAVRTVLLLASVAAFKTFDDIYVLTPNGGPGFSTEVPASFMFKTMFFKFSYGSGSAMAVFIIVECLIVTVFLLRLLRSRDLTY